MLDLELVSSYFLVYYLGTIDLMLNIVVMKFTYIGDYEYA